MKTYLVIAGILLSFLNVLLLVPATSTHTAPIAAIALVLSLLILTLSLLSGPKSRTTPGRGSDGAARLSSAKSSPYPNEIPATGPASLPVTIPPRSQAANQAEAEIVAFFALLQEKGRLIDFLMEDITSYDDTHVGAAARVIHQGCREVLQEHFNITAISESEEGSQVTVPAGYAKEQYRIVGNLSGQPPFTGTLIHKGWKTEFVKLPRIGETQRLPAIAPAEVELH
jgi:Domain of unknown function (DUF2760)